MSQPTHDATELFAGAGEVRALCRALDWSATTLGPVVGWPPALRTVVRACMDSPFPINLWCGPELALVYNDAYRQLLGAKHPWALGRPGNEVWAEIWPDIAPLFARIEAGGPPAYAEDAPFLVRRAGDPAQTGSAAGPNAWFTFALSGVRDESGALIAFLNVVSETTGRILAEREREAALAEAERAHARLRDVFTHAPAFLAVLRGRDHVFEYVNEAYYRLVGRRELLGRPAFEALPEMRGQGFDALLDRVLETGEPYVGREVPVVVYRDEAEEQRFVDLVYYPITEAGGVRSGVVAHGSDVTDHVLARREAQRARADAERANQAKSQFLANMSHEIRTPINAVMGYTDLLAAGVAGSLTDRQGEYVDRIRSSSQHLLGLVNDVLDLAKIEAGEIPVKSLEASAESVLTAALQMVVPQAEARGVALVPEGEWGEEVRFVGDPERVLQVVLNLLSNALKFTDPEGRVVLRCRTARVAPPDAALPEVGPWVVIEVEDTGSGIEPEHLSQIFEPFVQVEGGHTRRRGGTGLGLTISRRFARLMEGDITVRSRVGVGSCFTLWLVSPEQRAVEAVEWGAPAPWPPPGEVPGLGAVGEAVRDAADRVEEQLVRGLHPDGGFPSAAELDRVQLGDHTAAFVAALGAMLVALEQGGGDPALLRDSEEIQAIVARRHGRQRHRLGWTPAELDREYQLLHRILDEVGSAAAVRPGVDLASALGVLHRVLDRARELSLTGFQSAGEPEG